jgi:hypothetical protein
MQERQIGTLLFLELLGDSKSKKLADKSLYKMLSLVHSLAHYLILRYFGISFQILNVKRDNRPILEGPSG